MKSLLGLHRILTLDLGHLCRVSTHRDRKTISERLSKEGMSFLTITLPTFSKDFERSLEKGRILPGTFLSFKKAHGTCLPAFLQGFTSQVFDAKSGDLLGEPNVDSIFAVRQITLAFKKVEMQCTPERERAAYEQFVLTDHAVQVHSEQLAEHLLDGFKESARVLFKPVLRKLEEALAADPDLVVPKHGPGTTQDRTVGNDKYEWNVWTRRLEQVAKASKFLLPNGRWDERFLSIDWLDARDEPPVRVVTVPKTLKTPRIIAIEPVHMQYVQQGLMEILVDALESRAMHGALGFLDQVPNKELARVSSETREFATLDLSEASDRVSYQLAEAVFADYPLLWKWIDACRSKRADVPGVGVFHLAKFASMGSALCFPVEAMVFLTIIHAGWRESNPTQLYKTRSRFLQRVRVYGDDIIVPTDMAQSVSYFLDLFGLKVNEHKSFVTGKFRESCGGDFYDGIAVKPVYFRRNLPETRRDASEMLSTVSTRNQLYKSGQWLAARWLDSYLEGIAPFPVVSDESPVLGRHTFLQSSLRAERICSRLHRELVFGLVQSSKPPVSPLDGGGALMKFFLKRGESPHEDERHLERSGRPRSVDLRPRWGSLR